MPGEKRRGFAAVSRERIRTIAAMGGKSVPDEKRVFARSPETASRAGQKGGRAVAPEKRAFSMNRTLAQEAGRKGGLAAARRKAEAEELGSE